MSTNYVINAVWRVVKGKTYKLITLKVWKVIPFVALAFIGSVIWYNWQLLPNYEWMWQNLIWLGVAFSFYPISLLLLFVNWNDIMHKLGASIEWIPSFYIFCLNVINRRLPMGMLWSAGGRVNAYNEENVPVRVVSISLVIEFFFHGFAALLIWIVLEVFGYGYIRLLIERTSGNLIYGVGIFIILSVMGLIFIKYKNQSQDKIMTSDINISHGSRWVLLYGLTWVNAGVMLFFVIKAITNIYIPIEQIIATWALVGIIGYVFSIIPFVDVGSKEISLAFLLSQFMPLVQSILIAIVFRLLLTISDAVWPILFVAVLKARNRVILH